ncbi:MAG: hypothetical protein IT162_04735 [Bryobacterales bacterium]|nr:hypothetical protein [Bryobacterales bacterium]
MNRTRAAVVVSFLTLAGSCASPEPAVKPDASSAAGSSSSSPEIPPRFSSAELGIRTPAEAQAEFAKPFEGGVTVSHKPRGKGMVADCASALDLQAQGYAAVYPRDIGALGILTAKCLALQLAATARPARVSHFPAPGEVSSQILEFLPAGLAPALSATQQALINDASRSGRPLSAVEVTAAFEAARGDEIYIAGEEWQETLVVLARADFDGDGKLDWLTRADLAMRRGTHRVSRLFLLSRPEPQSLIRVARELSPAPPATPNK